MRRTLHKIWNGIVWCLIVVMLVFAALLLVPRAVGMRLYAVRTGSMEPAIPTGSLVVLKPTGGTALAVGDVITFRKADGSVVTHRIVSIDEAGNIATQGDANNTPDLTTTMANAVIGKVAFHVPAVGAVCEWVETKTGILTITAILILLLLAVFLPEVFAADDQRKGKNTTK
ncbi:MAG: signal peptidase I [Faecalibacterium sp.]|jgi:signal peptidase|nr:signal peptidase I [Faecalibacterium sp.]